MEDGGMDGWKVESNARGWRESTVLGRGGGVTERWRVMCVGQGETSGAIPSHETVSCSSKSLTCFLVDDAGNPRPMAARCVGEGMREFMRGLVLRGSRW